MTQTDMIFTHLLTYGSITPREALAEYGCMRLGARIYDLRKLGYKIISGKVTGYNRFGGKTSFAKYTLRDSQQISMFQEAHNDPERKAAPAD